VRNLKAPDDLNVKPGNSDGGVTFTLSCSEDSEGKRTVHLDAFGPAPYGHVYSGALKSLRIWLQQAETWVNE
jgi:hypothetical protein